MLWSDEVREFVGVLLLGVGAWGDLRERRAWRWLWYVMSCAGVLLVGAELWVGARVVHEAVPALVVALVGVALAWGIGRVRGVGGADWRAIVGLALLFPFQLGAGPPVWLWVVVVALCVGLVWACFRPRGGVPFLVPLWAVLVLRLAF